VGPYRRRRATKALPLAACEAGCLSVLPSGATVTPDPRKALLARPRLCDDGYRLPGHPAWRPETPGRRVKCSSCFGIDAVDRPEASRFFQGCSVTRNTGAEPSCAPSVDPDYLREDVPVY